MIEALVTNFKATPLEYKSERIEQITLFEKMAKYKTVVENSGICNQFSSCL